MVKRVFLVEDQNMYRNSAVSEVPTVNQQLRENGADYQLELVLVPVKEAMDQKYWAGQNLTSDDLVVSDVDLSREGVNFSGYDVGMELDELIGDEEVGTPRGVAYVTTKNPEGQAAVNLLNVDAFVLRKGEISKHGVSYGRGMLSYATNIFNDDVNPENVSPVELSIEDLV